MSREIQKEIKRVAQGAFNSANQVEGSKGFQRWWEVELLMNTWLRELPEQPSPPRLREVIEVLESNIALIRGTFPMVNSLVLLNKSEKLLAELKSLTDQPLPECG